MCREKTVNLNVLRLASFSQGPSGGNGAGPHDDSVFAPAAVGAVESRRLLMAHRPLRLPLAPASTQKVT
jgi:hypothetical protein